MKGFSSKLIETDLETTRLIIKREHGIAIWGREEAVSGIQIALVKKENATKEFRQLTRRYLKRIT